ncbi:MAG: hypothetical protein Q9166_006248 [cf. Caloplaca sp. 2 TL-2023]
MPSCKSLFLLLSLLGFYTLWVRMYTNGTIDALDVATKTGTFPNDHPLLNVFTGLAPIDNAIATLVGFFDGMTNGSDAAARLLFMDVVVTLHVAIGWLAIEQLRVPSRKYFSFLLPALWALAWNGFGAAFILPLYAYFNTPSTTGNPTAKTAKIPLHQARALLPTLIISSFLPAIVMFLSPILTTTITQHQTLIALFQFTPVATVTMQWLLASAIAKSSSGEAEEDLQKAERSNPRLQGSLLLSLIFSASIHLYCILTSILKFSFAGVYIPSPSSVHPNTDNAIAQGAKLFMQCDNIIICLTCTLWVSLMLQPHVELRGLWQQVGYAVALGLTTVVLGPGAVVTLGFWWMERKTSEVSGGDGAIKI